VANSNKTEYTVVFTPTDKANYATATCKVKLTVSKATPTVTAPKAKALTYTGKAQALITAGKTTGGTLQYKLGSGSYSTALPKATKAGSYTVYYKVVGNANYKDVAAKSLKVTIKTASVKVAEDAATATVTETVETEESPVRLAAEVTLAEEPEEPDTTLPAALTSAKLNVLIGDEPLEEDLVEVALGTEVNFVLGTWTDAEGVSLDVTGLTVCVDDKPTEIAVEEGQFTVPFREAGGFSVYVTAKAPDETLLKSQTVALNVVDVVDEVVPEVLEPADTAGARDPEAGAGSSGGCETGFAGIAALALIPALARKRR
jgi:Synergist-CTERM protein sorting domain-containing protein